MSEKSNIKKLVLSAKKGNQQAFNALYELTKNAVYYTCSSLLKNSEDVQDLCQDVFLAVFQKLNTLEDEEKFCGWVKRIAVNCCLKFNKGKVEYQIEDEALTNGVETNEVMLPEEYITNNSKREIILQLMSDTLTHSQYVTVFLFYFDELSIFEISEVLEVSEGTVKSRLNSARAKMKTAIEKYEEENNDRLHGVVLLPFFSSVFKTESESLKVPAIKINLPAVAGKKGFDILTTGILSTTKARVIAGACVLAFVSGMATSATFLMSGCGVPADKVTTETTVETTGVSEPTETVPEEVADAVKDNNLKVDKDGNITNEKGEKLEVNKDGEVKVTDDKGNTVYVKPETVKDVVENKGVITKPTTSTTNKGSSSTSTNKGSSTTNTNKGSSSTAVTQKPTKKPTQAPTQKPTEKVWHEAVYKTVHHPAETKVVHHDAVTHEEPIYKNTIVYKCNQCGAELADTNRLEQHYLANLDTCWSYHTVEKQIQTGTKTVVDKEAYDETVVVKKAWDEKVLVKEGYWEYK